MVKNIVLGLIALFLLTIFFLTRSTARSTRTWPSDVTTLKSRLEAIKLPALSTEGQVLHTHQHLDLFINGAVIQVPSDIGVGLNHSFISPIHTHDTTGIIHVESPVVEKYFLGQFFDIWGVKFDQSCINNFCRGGDNLYDIYVNGQPYSGDFRALELTPHQQIYIFYGPKNLLPGSIPSSYTFPKDY